MKKVKRKILFTPSIFKKAQITTSEKIKMKTSFVCHRVSKSVFGHCILHSPSSKDFETKKKIVLFPDPLKETTKQLKNGG